MAKHDPWYKNVNSKIQRWFEAIEQNELLDVNEFIEQARQGLNNLENVSEEKLTQFIQNLRYDLNDFYQQNQQEAKHSIYLAVLEEAWWQKLADMSDKTQIEWAELSADLEHHGEYATGDVIGFGVLECQACKARSHITHLSEVQDCRACGHNKFSRLLLAP